MEKMKLLADQLREEMAKPTVKKVGNGMEAKNSPVKKAKDKALPDAVISLLAELKEYDNSDHKTMVHFRLDKASVDLINNFKIATGVDATRLIAFAVRQFISANPELKTIIKQFIQNSSL